MWDHKGPRIVQLSLSIQQCRKCHFTRLWSPRNTEVETAQGLLKTGYLDGSDLSFHEEIHARTIGLFTRCNLLPKAIFLFPAFTVFPRALLPVNWTPVTLLLGRKVGDKLPGLLCTPGIWNSAAKGKWDFMNRPAFWTAKEVLKCPQDRTNFWQKIRI